MGTPLGNLGTPQHDAQMHVERIEGRAYLCNGLDPMKRYDNRTNRFQEAGLLPPIFNPTLTAAAGGALDGTFQLVMTEYDKIHNIESDPGPAMSIVCGNQFIQFSAWPEPRNPFTTHFRIYRGFANVSFATAQEAAAREDVQAIPMARTLEVTTSPGAGFTDNFDEDTLLERLVDFPISWWRGYPPTFAYPRLVRRRLFGWGQFGFRQGTVRAVQNSKYVFPDVNANWNRSIIGQRIAIGGATDWYEVVDFSDSSPLTIEIDPPFRDPNVTGANYFTWAQDGKLVWSQEDQPESFPIANHRFIAKGQGLRGTGIGEVRGFPIMFAHDQTWLLQFHDDPSQENMAQEQQLSGSVGCVSHNSIQKVTLNGGERLVWLSRYGIAATGGQGVDVISDQPIHPGGLKEYFDNMALDSKGEAQVACAVNYVPGHLYICAFPTEDAKTGCDEVIVWDYLNNNFWRWKFKWEITSMEIGERFVPNEDDANKAPRRRPVVLFGTDHGHVMYWPAGENDAAGRDDTEGTLEGTVDVADDTSLTDDSSEFMLPSPESPPDLRGLDGAYVTVLSATTGLYQHKAILVNTGIQLFVSEWDWVPQQGDSYWIGEIENFYLTPKIDFGSVTRLKMVEKLHLIYSQEDQGELELTTFQDQNPTPMELADGSTIDLTGETNTPLSRDNSANQKGRAPFPINARCHHFQWQVGNRKPNQPWTIKGAALEVAAK